MRRSGRWMALGAVACVCSVAWGQATEASIAQQMNGLRGLSDVQRPAATVALARDIQMLPAGMGKLKLADSLAHLVTEGDPGRETLQAVADTLATALTETPLPAKDGAPPMPYMDLAKFARYEGISTRMQDPLLTKADAVLMADDAEISRADFSLRDLKGETVTLSGLRGKIVLVNFWATWCPPCRKEMPDLDAIYRKYQRQGLVIVSLSDEDQAKVASFIGAWGYLPPVLLDTGGKVKDAFHVDGIPKSFVFDREGKLVTESIDMRTQRQFLAMLAKAGLKP